jgi:hypothetical protein
MHRIDDEAAEAAIAGFLLDRSIALEALFRTRLFIMMFHDITAVAFAFLLLP